MADDLDDGFVDLGARQLVIGGCVSVAGAAAGLFLLACALFAPPILTRGAGEARSAQLYWFRRYLFAAAGLSFAMACGSEAAAAFAGPHAPMDLEAAVVTSQAYASVLGFAALSLAVVVTHASALPVGPFIVTAATLHALMMTVAALRYGGDEYARSVQWPSMFAFAVGAASAPERGDRRRLLVASALLVASHALPWTLLSAGSSLRPHDAARALQAAAAVLVAESVQPPPEYVDDDDADNGGTKKDA